MASGLTAYHLRPNKVIDRGIFIELLNNINRERPVESYTYAGFGSYSFEDFRAIHNELHIKKMISIERDENTFLRQKFNKPIKCIRPRKQSSDLFVSTYDIKGNAIIWLDYEEPGELRSQVQEFETLLPKLREYDILRVTVNANPDELYSSERGRGENLGTKEINVQRLKRLIDRVGSDYLPHGVDAIHTTESNLPLLYCEVFRLAVARSMKSTVGTGFLPLLILSYADTRHQMLTITGIILREIPKREFLRETKLQNWPYRARTWEDVHAIRVPALTMAEKIYIDKRLPSNGVKRVHSGLGFLFDEEPAVSIERVKEYAKFYKHYPTFVRIEY